MANKQDAEIRTIDSLIVQIGTAYHKAIGLPADVSARARQWHDGYDQLAERVAGLVDRATHIAATLARRFPVVLCDEHQDSSPHQHGLVMKLHAAGARLRMFGDTHRMPMHAALHAHLSTVTAAQEKFDPTAFVMPHLAALKEREISKTFRETILPRVGISQPYAERTESKGVGRKLAAYSVHSLRHSLSTWLNESGVSEMMRMRLVGHEDGSVSRGYTHTELAQVAKELEKIQAL